MIGRLNYLGCALLTLTIVLGGCGRENPEVQQALAEAPVYKRMEIISSPNDARGLLIEGNERFSRGNPLSKDLSSTRRTELMKNGQHPFAVIVCCSDSRVPPELLFDQALGDLFVVRVAGNVVSPIEMGSIEYAVEHIETPLVVVLGHEACGAVTAAVQGGETHGSIAAILNEIKPAVEKAKALGTVEQELITKSTELNIQNVKQEITKSPIIEERLGKKQVDVIGMMYDLDEGILRLSN